jgi:hypothetical protein
VAGCRVCRGSQKTLAPQGVRTYIPAQWQPRLPCLTAEGGMAKKAERAGKPAKAQKTDRWTVRGVPAKLQKAAGDAARARGMTLGQWLGTVLTTALAQRRAAPAEAAERWEQAVERRLQRLEEAVFASGTARPEGAPAVAEARPS